MLINKQFNTPALIRVAKYMVQSAGVKTLLLLKLLQIFRDT